MLMNLQDFTQTIRKGISCKCPKCGIGALFSKALDLSLNDKCDHCGLNLQNNDSADGPAVFLIFILGALVVPLALWLDAVATIPLWVHAIIWLIVILGLTLLSLKPLKSYIFTLQYKYRPDDWKD